MGTLPIDNVVQYSTIIYYIHLSFYKRLDIVLDDCREKCLEQ